MTERERYRTLGLYAQQVAGNYEQAIEHNRALVERYPGDSSGFNNLAVAYFMTLNFPSALEAGRQAIALNARRARYPRTERCTRCMRAISAARVRRRLRPSARTPPTSSRTCRWRWRRSTAATRPLSRTPTIAWRSPDAAALRWRRQDSPTTTSTTTATAMRSQDCSRRFRRRAGQEHDRRDQQVFRARRRARRRRQGRRRRGRGRQGPRGVAP